MESHAQHPEEFGIGRLFWTTSEAIIGADLLSGGIVLWNPAAQSLFGYPAEQALGMPLERLVPDELRGQHLSGFRRYHTTGAAVLVGGPPIEVPAVTRSGEHRDIALTLTDVSDANRSHVLAVIRDVTEQRQAERELARTNQAMREFVAAASHELRTPLAIVAGHAHVLQESPDLLTSDERSEAVASIARAARQASRLVSELLTLSQIQAGVVGARPGVVDVGACAQRAAAAAATEATVPAEGSVTALVDPDHLERMLVNLLVNAVRYGAPPVRVTASVTGSTVEVAVTDAGPGVPHSLLPRLFSAFARGESDHSDSTGLGLSIVKGLVEANAGTVRYEDDTDGGGRFTLVLPRPG